MVLIRQAKAEDAGAALNFYHGLIDKMKDHPARPTWTKGVYPLLSDLEGAIRKNELFLAVEQEESGVSASEAVVGSVIVTDRQDEAYGRVVWSVDTERVAVVHLLATDPDRHGQGIGRKLLETVRKAALERGAEVVRLDTLPHNVPARHLYESFGFQFMGEIELYYPSAGTIPFAMYELPVRPETAGHR